MYVRRKVFSVMSDETGEERLFSTNEVEFVGQEDYNVENQREFADSEESEDSKMKKAAKVLGISTAALATAIGVGKLTGVGLRKAANIAEDRAGRIKPGANSSDVIDKVNKYYSWGRKKYMVEKPYDVIAKGVKSGYNKASEGVKSGYNKASEGVKAGYNKVKGAFKKEQK